MKEIFIREWQIFLLSIAIFTRIPISATVPYSEERKNQSYQYCGLVGLLVGSLSALVFYCANMFWPLNVAIVMSMIFSVYITGAFHEDGFADTCDGFGGGLTPEHKLEIMKDSRIGAYALLGMVLLLLLKFTSLTALPTHIPTALILGHVISRTFSVSYMYTHGYVRHSEQSKLHIVKSPNSTREQIILITILSVVVFTLLTAKTAIMLLVVLYIVRLWLGQWLLKHIGGYTGDTLGAIQQIVEVVCYLLLFLI